MWCSCSAADIMVQPLLAFHWFPESRQKCWGEGIGDVQGQDVGFLNYFNRLCLFLTLQLVGFGLWSLFIIVTFHYLYCWCERELPFPSIGKLDLTNLEVYFWFIRLRARTEVFLEDEKLKYISVRSNSAVFTASSVSSQTLPCHLHQMCDNVGYNFIWDALCSNMRASMSSWANSGFIRDLTFYTQASIDLHFQVIPFCLLHSLFPPRFDECYGLIFLTRRFGEAIH